MKFKSEKLNMNMNSEKSIRKQAKTTKNEKTTLNKTKKNIRNKTNQPYHWISTKILAEKRTEC